ncbi:unnamed protein product, partial [Allacma fusca]
TFAQTTANENTQVSRTKAKINFDATHSPIEYLPSQLVLLADFSRKVGFVNKFLPAWKGPFEVIEKLNPVTYLVQDRRNNKSTSKPSKAHVQNMKPYFPPTFSPPNNTYPNDPKINCICPQMNPFEEPMDIDVLLGDLGSPLPFISWEDEMEALLDNLPPESPPNSHSTPDSEDL